MRLRPPLAILLAVALCACGGDEGEDGLATPEYEGDGVRVGTVATTGGATAGPSAGPVTAAPPPATTKKARDRDVPEAPKPKFELRVTLADAKPVRGEPVLAWFELRNLSDDPQSLVNSREDLAQRTEIQVLRAGAAVEAGGALPIVPPGDPSRVDAVRPGDVVSAQVDLLPALIETRAYQEPKVRFKVRYRGSADLASGTSTMWNADPANEVVSREYDIELQLPRWLDNLGATDSVVAEARNAAQRFRPGAPDEAEHLSRIAGFGDAGWGALLLLTGSIGVLDAEQSELGGRALRMLRAGAEKSLAAARRAESKDPALLMARDVLVADRAERDGLPPPSLAATAVRDVAGGGEGATWAEIVLEDATTTEPVSYLLDDDGKLSVTRGAGGNETTATRALTTDDLAILKRALVASRLASWRRLRTIRAEDEGMVYFRIGRGDRLVFDVALPEREALRANPLSAAVVTAFAEVSKGLRPREETSQE